MPANKTEAHAGDVKAFVDALPDANQRGDALTLIDMMTRLSGEPATMWGSSIIGFGRYHYRYESGREGDAMRIGFAPRKGQTVIYLMDGYAGHGELLASLGKHKTDKSCLYVKRLSDIDTGVLEAMIARSLAAMDERYPR